MKNHRFLQNKSFIIFFSITVCVLYSCLPAPVETFDNKEVGVTIEKALKQNVSPPDSTILVMTWNIRFGIGRNPWFGDACGDKSTYSKEVVMANLEKIKQRIYEIHPDILLLQEVDINSTRSGYTDQFQWLLDNTYFNYATYGSQWNAQFIPSDGLGKLMEVNALYSLWPITESIRTQLALRTEQMFLEKYLYERCCMVTSKVEIPGFKDLYVVNIHASAFATDDTKHNHLIAFKNELDSINSLGAMFVAGGDLNEIPPGSDSLDFCMENMCQGESYHHSGDNPFHRGGANFAPEQDWLNEFYLDYKCAIPIDDYHKNNLNYYTATSQHPDHFWERALDYLFTNNHWNTNGTIVHQNFRQESDHAPVSSVLVLKKK